MQETEPIQENTGNEVHGGGGDPDRKLKPMQGNVGNVHIYSGWDSALSGKGHPCRELNHALKCS